MICIYNQIDSTNKHLLDISSNNISKLKLHDFSSILGLNQVAGYGKYNRKWDTGEGNLALSFFLSSNKFNWIQDNNISFLSILLGIIFVEQLNSYFKDNRYFFLKYPNDIMLENKKVGGFLIETSIQDKDVNLVCGIGLNLVSSPDLEGTTSIYNSTNKRINQISFAQDIIDLLKRELYYRILDKKKIVRDFFNNSFLKFNDKITIKLSDRSSITGLYDSLSEDGSLILRIENNKIIKISHGDIFI